MSTYSCVLPLKPFCNSLMLHRNKHLISELLHIIFIIKVFKLYLYRTLTFFLCSFGLIHIPQCHHIPRPTSLHMGRCNRYQCCLNTSHTCCCFCVNILSKQTRKLKRQKSLSPTPNLRFIFFKYIFSFINQNIKKVSCGGRSGLSRSDSMWTSSIYFLCLNNLQDPLISLLLSFSLCLLCSHSIRT